MRGDLTIRQELLSLCAAYDLLRQKGGVLTCRSHGAEPEDRPAIDIQALTLR